ncbi:NAD(P)H-dependent oxidoreductase [Halovulum dunhuangense]|uniref:NAD(P)H-dependent oxidoreductase n=1 Tax=Halovulum dunhuangense TaxID=1505036 RepID=A0A849L7I7_9RHOB|nr:NADPH-dependent FMN reductase [Halovulum dunhuangense]NNU82060.1 NAD(P)H-dependent oxidoreductase [Halovulum dunhuangense]
MTKLLFVCGSLRAQSSARGTQDALIARLGARATCATTDIGRLPHYNADITDNADVAAFMAQVAGADGVVFVTPEYNYSIPGVLKNAIDWASRPGYASVFKDRPCFVITVSGGALGGVRAQSALKIVLGAMLARVFPWQEVIVPQAPAKLKDGLLADEAILDFADKGLTAFLAEIGSL